MIGIKKKLKYAAYAAFPIIVGAAGSVSATTDLSGTTDLIMSIVPLMIIIGVVGAIMGAMKSLGKW